MKVFVTDGHHKNTLAIVRSLGGHGVHVVVAPVQRAQACYSEFCAERVGYLASVALSRPAARVRERTRLLAADAAAMAVAADKHCTMVSADVTVDRIGKTCFAVSHTEPETSK